MKISLVVGDRNDDYGGKELAKKRFETFISYHAYYFQKFSLDYELVLVDYNSVFEKESLYKKFNWDKFSRVKELKVSNEEHKLLTQNSDYPYFGNLAFNLGAAIAEGDFLLSVNVDSYLSPELIKYLSNKSLDENYFYRTDLIYFKQKYFRNPLVHSLWTKHSKVRCARRHSSSVNLSESRYKNKLDPKINFTDRYYVQKYISRLNHNEEVGGFFYSTKEWPEFPRQPDELTSWITRSGLHTNASGDFILLSKKAFIETKGYPEDSRWNLHIDSYLLLHLVKKGYKQILFKYPLVTYHADHQRGGWQGMAQISYEEWCNLVVEMLNS